MKFRHILILLIAAALLAWAYNKTITSTEHYVSTETSGMGDRLTEELTFDDLLDAIEWVESKGDPWAIGDDGRAVGAYQIHKIYVDDVRRIMLKRFATYSWSVGVPNYQSRQDPEKSRDMVTTYLKHYGGTFEEMARKHNGGPKGHLKEATKSYWLKVKARMETK
jgi:hypothetical protein